MDKLTGIHAVKEALACNLPVDDPYNMYFTPNGQYAVVVAEARQHLDFRDPHTFKLEHRVTVNCAGVDHIDFAANGAYLIATCEFASRLVRVDLHTLTVDGYLDLPGSSPQDIKLDAHEKRYPPKRPLLRFLASLNKRLPNKWDRKLNRFVPDDDWLLWDFKRD